MLRFSASQTEMIDQVERERWFSALQRDLAAHHPDIAAPDADALFRASRAECERLGIVGADAIEAFLGLSFLAGEPLSAGAGYDMMHARVMRKGHSPDVLPLALHRRVLREMGVD